MGSLQFARWLPLYWRSFLCTGSDGTPQAACSKAGQCVQEEEGKACALKSWAQLVQAAGLLSLPAVGHSINTHFAIPLNLCSEARRSSARLAGRFSRWPHRVPHSGSSRALTCSQQQRCALGRRRSGRRQQRCTLGFSSSGRQPASARDSSGGSRARAAGRAGAGHFRDKVPAQQGPAGAGCAAAACHVVLHAAGGDLSNRIGVSAPSQLPAQGLGGGPLRLPIAWTGCHTLQSSLSIGTCLPPAAARSIHMCRCKG